MISILQMNLCKHSRPDFCFPIYPQNIIEDLIWEKLLIKFKIQVQDSIIYNSQLFLIFYILSFLWDESHQFPALPDTSYLNLPAKKTHILQIFSSSAKCTVVLCLISQLCSLLGINRKFMVVAYISVNGY